MFELTRDEIAGISQFVTSFSLKFSANARLQLLPLRQVAFGHKGSKSDSVARTDQTSEVWRPEESVRESLFGLRLRREAASSHQADRGR